MKDSNSNTQFIDIRILNSLYKRLSIRLNIDILISHLMSEEIMSFDDCEILESDGRGRLEKDNVFNWIQNYLQITNKKEAFTCLKTITNALKDDEFIK
jgi:hypothetical protein